MSMCAREHVYVNRNKLKGIPSYFYQEQDAAVELQEKYLGAKTKRKTPIVHIEDWTHMSFWHILEGTILIKGTQERAVDFDEN